jgi:hypothetical protein
VRQLEAWSPLSHSSATVATMLTQRLVKVADNLASLTINDDFVIFVIAPVKDTRNETPALSLSMPVQLAINRLKKGPSAVSGSSLCAIEPCVERVPANTNSNARLGLPQLGHAARTTSLPNARPQSLQLTASIHQSYRVCPHNLVGVVRPSSSSTPG